MPPGEDEKLLDGRIAEGLFELAETVLQYGLVELVLAEGAGDEGPAGHVLSEEFAYGAEELDAVHPRHRVVRDDVIGPVLREPRKGLFRAGEGLEREFHAGVRRELRVQVREGVLHVPSEQAGHEGLVINDNNRNQSQGCSSLPVVEAGVQANEKRAICQGSFIRIYLPSEDLRRQ